jgi:tRNA threonylcarbamoyl adenosine modification protein (Sua5/YciO/YrdC/YwlC family)
MPEIHNKDEFQTKKTRLLRELKECLFIYPTDTIYGIGCDAMNEELVDQVRKVKQRHHLPFSVIAPNKEWIKEHCVVDEEAEKWLEKLPGPYTLVLKLNDPNTIPTGVNMGLDTLGVRIPEGWFSKVVAELNVPIITTSANLTGDDHMTSIEDLNPIIKKNVQHVFYDGPLTGRPSKIVRLDKEGEVVER